MSIIVIDTCVFISENDFFFKKPKFRLLKYIKDNKVIIPSVIIEEIVSNVKKKLVSINENVVSQNKKIDDIGLSLDYHYIVLNGHEIDEAIEVFSKRIENFYKSNDIEIKNYPSSITLEEILNRALNRKKPFKEDGGDSGLKDYIIWKTIIQILKDNDDELIFITNNKKDFCSDAHVHHDLIEDIEQLDLKKNIKILTLDEYIKLHNIEKSLEDVNNIVSELLDGNLDVCSDDKLKDFENYLIDNLETITNTLDIYSEFYCYQVQIDSLYEFTLMDDSIKFLELEDNEVYIEFFIKCEADSSIGGWNGVDIGVLNICLKINLTYDKQDQLITSISIDEANFMNGFSNDDLYQAEHAYHMRYIKD